MFITWINKGRAESTNIEVSISSYCWFLFVFNFSENRAFLISKTKKKDYIKPIIRSAEIIFTAAGIINKVTLHMYLSNLYIHHQQIQYDQNYQNIAKIDERTNSHTKLFVMMRK